MSTFDLWSNQFPPKRGFPVRISTGVPATIPVPDVPVPVYAGPGTGTLVPVRAILGLRVKGSRFGVWGLGLRVEGFGFRV